MAALLIKNVPTNLHNKLKEIAVRHHRSMTQEALVLLEEAVDRSSVVGEFGAPLKGRFKLNQNFINRAKQRGRA